MTWRQKSRPALGIFLFLALLSPMLNIVFPLEVIGAERFLYLPSVGFVLALGWGYSILAERHRALAGVMLFFHCGYYAALASKRDAVWASESSFWTATTHDAPQSPRAWNGLGVVKMRQGDLPGAITHFEHAISLNPELLDAHLNLAISLWRWGNTEKGKAGMEYVVSRRPYDVQALYQLARAEEAAGNIPVATGYYERMSKLLPQDEWVASKLMNLRGIKR